ncbi:cryptochrome/photolyase family protein [Halococcus thailandensis]|uniref:Deoxyribodipyrimidine photolyase n=1 Tax=Halococcus thailandensis JCM 13552 TaxID=1227457 RepID=M0MVE2_9EURY|nr:deoxyribodipyrimidine photo-lyase [Halococcus thailandensis]EMA49551.1 deoxyribodipyrimidine photolyase [Halococcus thailandensis JCM 13552]
MRIHWHRRDLRAADNRALAAAAEDGPVLPVFVFDPDVLQYASPPRVAFLLAALDSLQKSYRERGSDLYTVEGDPAEVLPEIADEHGVGELFWNHDYTGLARERDERVREALDEAGIAHEAFHDALHHEPGTITTNDGDPYSVFSYFGDKWLDREKEEPYPDPGGDALADVENEALPTIEDLGFDEPAAEIPDAGTEAARDRLDAFCNDGIAEYDEGREYPADEGTSRLSQDLNYGTIGVREVTKRVGEMREDADEDERDGIDAYRRELAFGEFFAHVLFYNPELVVENYKSYENPIDWREDDGEFQAWKEGTTGYPIVDAGMRQLREEAYMHNRVRMIVASFLTKDLMLDWREGYAHFRERLVDHDTANDNGNWQWAASTGTDAQPYFRVFNPMTQGEKYDPDADYIKTYVPELDDTDPETIHSWNELSDEERESAAPDYPAPICEHGERREEAIEMFERARGEG